jgi:hypothetical protein
MTLASAVIVDLPSGRPYEPSATQRRPGNFAYFSNLAARCAILRWKRVKEDHSGISV